jgi:hypothetical protein
MTATPNQRGTGGGRQRHEPRLDRAKAGDTGRLVARDVAILAESSGG